MAFTLGLQRLQELIQQQKGENFYSQTRGKLLGQRHFLDEKL